MVQAAALLGVISISYFYIYVAGHGQTYQQFKWVTLCSPWCS